MIRAPTVFIVGAGASAEFGLPLGAGLLRKIVEGFTYEFDPFGRAIRGDSALFEVIKSYCGLDSRGQFDADLANRLIEAGLAIRASAVGPIHR